MQYKIFATVLMGSISFMSAVAADDIELNGDNFSSHLLEVLATKDTNGDNVLQADEISQITEIEITGTGKTDELSLEGIQYLTSLEKLTLNNLKYSGDFCFVYSTSTGDLYTLPVKQVVVSNCELDEVSLTPTKADIVGITSEKELENQLQELQLKDKTVFTNIHLKSSVGRRVKTSSGLRDITIGCKEYNLSDTQVQLLNLEEQTSYSLTSDVTGSVGYFLLIQDCAALENIDATTPSKIQINGVPSLKDIQWKEDKKGYSYIGPSTLSNILGVATAKKLIVYDNMGISSEAEIELVDKNAPIDLSEYGLVFNRVQKLTNASKDGDILLLDWSNAVDGVLTITYNYSSFSVTNSGDDYMSVSIKARIKSKDQAVPVIVLDGESDGDDTYYEGVKVSATDDVGVTSLTVNSTEVLSEAPYAITSPGGYTIIAKDASGKTAQRVINVIEKAPVDDEKPIIVLSGETEDGNNYKVGVSVDATDNVGVTSLKVNGEEKIGTLPYTINAAGTYNIEASDAAGNIEQKTITVVEPTPEPDPEPIDDEKPVIVLSGETEDGNNYKVGVSVDATDNVGVTSLTINGEEKMGSLPYVINAEGEYTIEAKDAAGNTEQKVIKVENPKVEPEPDPEVPDKPVVVPTDINTSIFKRVNTSKFKGIEILSKEILDVEVYTEAGAKVDIEKEVLDSSLFRVALPSGKYKVNFGQLFQNIPVEIE
ncbi:MAG: hypothetical protein Q4C30_02205 [Bacteroidia bacterium]|nr:hypothetical protein [Bacteroidia bacterium]